MALHQQAVYNFEIITLCICVQAKSEIYMGVLKKHLCFFPGLPFGCQLGRWTLPQTEMQTLATCVRRLARLLWTLHLTFQEVSQSRISIDCYTTHSC